MLAFARSTVAISVHLRSNAVSVFRKGSRKKWRVMSLTSPSPQPLNRTPRDGGTLFLPSHLMLLLGFARRTELWAGHPFLVCSFSGSQTRVVKGVEEKTGQLNHPGLWPQIQHL